jgi:oligopeptide transport system ATP-binding protein
VQAVRDVSVEVGLGETLGIVGESGSGKSTLGRLLVGLLRPDSGSINFGDLHWGPNPPPKQLRREFQMVFQDPYSSLDPTKTVEYTVREPLVVNRIGDRASRHRDAREMIVRVGLHPAVLQRYPFELSGGQRQRVAIARALVTQPKVLVCDEPLSALDVSTQAQVMNLLLELQRDFGMAMVFISHDISIVHNIADHIAVMYMGELVEVGVTDAVLRNPRHPYTKTLLAAVPGNGNRRRASAGGQAVDASSAVNDSDLPGSAGSRLNSRRPDTPDDYRDASLNGTQETLRPPAPEAEGSRTNGALARGIQHARRAVAP